MDIKLRPVDGSLHPAGHVQVVPLDGQALEILGQAPWIHPKVEEGRDEHVAGDARTEVKVEVFHGQVGVEGRTRALMALAAYPAPNPLSMLTTVRPLAQEFSMPSSAVSPPICDPYPTLVGTPMIGAPMSPPTTEGRAASIPATTMTTLAFWMSGKRARRRWRPATPTS